MTRELGGGRFAQALACLTVLLAPVYLAFGSFLSMNAFEPLFWMTCAYILVRILKGSDQRLWLLFGLVAGIGLQNKHTMLMFGAAVVIRHNSHARVETHAHEVVLVWRDSRTCHLPTQPDLGGPTQLVSNPSCTECPAAQEHSGWCVAFFWRADSILKSSGFASNPRGFGMASFLEKREAIPISWVGVSRRDRGGRDPQW